MNQGKRELDKATAKSVESIKDKFREENLNVVLNMNHRDRQLIVLRNTTNIINNQLKLINQNAALVEQSTKTNELMEQLVKALGGAKKSEIIQ